MKRLLPVLCLSLFNVLLSAQTDLEGVINHYARVIAVEEDPCLIRLEVSDTTGFRAEEQVVILQVQGAAINSNDESAFGTITNIGGAGWYEINYIDSVGANDLFLPFALQHPYDLTGQVQVITMPTYSEAEVNNTLTAAPWNGTAGGVLALEVTETLTLNAPIDVSGRGFRGGLSQTNLPNDCNWLFPQNDYHYDLGSWRGAAKGEGIADFVTGKEAGRGAQANGGGGGNDHNAGGGGGAHLATGGQGGENDEPSAFGCSGQFPGRGGRGIASAEERLFFGGGGGAGHANNDLGTDGGTGGGIVILRVQNLITNDQPIISSGTTPEDGGGDGAGGGGAGGSLLLDIVSLNDGLTVDVSGGDGGMVDNGNFDRCHGPGGGGSGGRVLLTFPALPAAYFPDLSGGMAGQTINSSSCGNGTNGANAGQAGETNLIAAPVISEEPLFEPVMADFSYTVTGTIVSFDNLSVNGDTYLWDFGDDNTSVSFNPSHNFIDAGFYTVTLTVFGPCNTALVEQEIEIVLENLAEVSFTANDANGCAPWLVQFTDQTSGNILDRQWSFPGGTPASSTEANPEVLYTTPGVYPVQLFVTNSAGTSMLEIDDYVEIYAPVTADFGFAIDEATVDFINQSLNGINFQWDFGDGSPPSTELMPSHTYAQPGTYLVTLVANGENCASVTTQQVYVIFVGTEEQSWNDWVKVFPNPTRGELQIVAEERIRFARVEIFDPQGRLLMLHSAAETNTLTLDLSTYPAGSYFLRLLSADKVWVFPIEKY